MLAGRKCRLKIQILRYFINQFSQVIYLGPDYIIIIIIIEISTGDHLETSVLRRTSKILFEKQLF